MGTFQAARKAPELVSRRFRGRHLTSKRLAEAGGSFRAAFAPLNLLHAIVGPVLLAAVASVAVGQAPQPTAPADAKRPMTAAGLPLPLRGDETLLPVANGCAAVGIKVPPEVRARLNKAKWIGACRFGLLDGKGFWDNSAYGPSLSEGEYRLGIMQPGIFVFHSGYGGKWVERRAESYSAFNRPEHVYVANWSLPASSGDQSRNLMVKYAANPDIWSRYFEQSFACPYPTDPIPDKDLKPFSQSDQQLLKQHCRTRGRTGARRYVEHKRVEEPGFGLNFPDGQRQHTLSVQHYLCRSENDCREAWATATAAEWPEVERLKAELTAAHRAFMVEWEARFAPLEAAFQAKLKSLSTPPAPRRVRRVK